MNRRKFLTFLALLSPAVIAYNFRNFLFKKESVVIKNIIPIDFQWPMQEPFLFCAHHYDRYPAGNKNFGLDAKHFSGRQMGSDFNLKDGFRIYHGEEIPGFPVHPHRGFETITIVRKGYVDHADSLGAAGRYGEGDVQWMTAGSGVQHSEMFPLLHQDKENTLELFQVWINLPKKNKLVPADFQMLWSHDIPIVKKENLEVTVINGSFEGTHYYNAPKNSWAADKENEVNIFLVRLEKDGEFKIPKSKIGTNRTLYYFEGSSIDIDGKLVNSKSAIYLDSNEELTLKSKGNCELMFLEARPIGEPIFQHGPFVMNTKQEVIETIDEYRKTEFGGWNWERKDMIHGEKIEKFAKFPDGKIERPSV